MGTKVQAEMVVETVIELHCQLPQEEEAKRSSVAGLGIFSVKQRAARTSPQPRTGESVQVAAMKVPKFRAAKALATQSNSLLPVFPIFRTQNHPNRWFCLAYKCSLLYLTLA